MDTIGTDNTWTDYDPAVLDEDDSMLMDWETFCKTVKFRRRFFFQRVGESNDTWNDTRSARQLLRDISKLIDSRGLIVTLQPGRELFRARPRETEEHLRTAAELGPPPAERAIQSNRMNPPGIPMFYGSDTPILALEETRSELASVGTFITERPLRILDLV